MQKILVIEDDSTIRKGLTMWLEKSGFQVSIAVDGKEAIDVVSNEKFDLVVLDIMLPKIDGYGVLEHIRSMNKRWLPVIMLTAKSEEEDKVLGLELGADDYMSKPFSNRELEARIRANLRKRSLLVSEEDITTNLFIMDDIKYRIKKDSKDVEVTRKEMDLLKILVKSKGSYIDKKDLLENVWGYLDSDDTRTLDIHISKIRKKLQKLGIEDVIMTKRGYGYAFIEE